MTVRELAGWLGATFEGDGEKQVEGAAALEAAGGHEIAFVGNAKAAREAQDSAAGCLVVPQDYPNPSGRTVIRAPDPRAAIARIINRLHPAARPAPDIHATAIVPEGTAIGKDVHIGAWCVLGNEVTLGHGVIIEAGCVLGNKVTLGAGTHLHSRVTLYSDVEVGERCIFHSGVVLGGDGFGFVFQNGRFDKFPQIGRVVIGNDVEMGANSTVDRAALGVTWVGDGTKLDNMVHIGHNCQVGRHVVMAAQTGLGGGAIIEDYAILGGQVGIADNVRVETRAVIGAKSGVPTSKVIRSGQTVWGLPARPLKDYLHEMANLARLPELKREVAELKARLAALEEKQH